MAKVKFNEAYNGRDGDEPIRALAGSEWELSDAKVLELETERPGLLERPKAKKKAEKEAV